MPTCRWTSGWALTPPELVSAHLKLNPEVMEALRKNKVPVVPA
jgi:oxalate decarboxylase